MDNEYWVTTKRHTEKTGSIVLHYNGARLNSGLIVDRADLPIFDSCSIYVVQSWGGRTCIDQGDTGPGNEGGGTINQEILER